MLLGFVVGGGTFWTAWRWGLLRWRWQGTLRSLTWREQRAVLRAVRSRDVPGDQGELAVARAGAGDLRATSLPPLVAAAAMGAAVVTSAVELYRSERFLRAAGPAARTAQS